MSGEDADKGSPQAILRRAFQRAFDRPAPAAVRIGKGWDEMKASPRPLTGRGAETPRQDAASPLRYAHHDYSKLAAKCLRKHRMASSSPDAASFPCRSPSPGRDGAWFHGACEEGSVLVERKGVTVTTAARTVTIPAAGLLGITCQEGGRVELKAQAETFVLTLPPNLVDPFLHAAKACFVSQGVLQGSASPLPCVISEYSTKADHNRSPPASTLRRASSIGQIDSPNLYSSVARSGRNPSPSPPPVQPVALQGTPSEPASAVPTPRASSAFGVAAPRGSPSPQRLVPRPAPPTAVPDTLCPPPSSVLNASPSAFSTAQEYGHGHDRTPTDVLLSPEPAPRGPLASGDSVVPRVAAAAQVVNPSSLPRLRPRETQPRAALGITMPLTTSRECVDNALDDTIVSLARTASLSQPRTPGSAVLAPPHGATPELSRAIDDLVRATVNVSQRSSVATTTITPEGTPQALALHHVSTTSVGCASSYTPSPVAAPGPGAKMMAESPPSINLTRKGGEPHGHGPAAVPQFFSINVGPPHGYSSPHVDDASTVGTLPATPPPPSASAAGSSPPPFYSRSKVLTRDNDVQLSRRGFGSRRDSTGTPPRGDASSKSTSSPVERHADPTATPLCPPPPNSSFLTEPPPHDADNLPWFLPGAWVRDEGRHSPENDTVRTCIHECCERLVGACGTDLPKHVPYLLEALSKRCAAEAAMTDSQGGGTKQEHLSRARAELTFAATAFAKQDCGSPQLRPSDAPPADEAGTVECEARKLRQATAPIGS
eukprot:TRINITY_DN32837_c0_g1_i1.p1 TRINITY_DN32837_c0_g1~~TRINITY_DN32837_c0_g1_i1.p1  ORF type:complete len:788 (+),score=129.40 TRINITY_DN32837_c0_g1_i1:49-2364(+)